MNVSLDNNGTKSHEVVIEETKKKFPQLDMSKIQIGSFAL